MSAGSYVGRIGGLAVALGVGAAIVAGAGIASAEDSDGASASSSSSSASSSSASSESSSGSSGSSENQDSSVGGATDAADDSENSDDSVNSGDDEEVAEGAADEALDDEADELEDAALDDEAADEASDEEALDEAADEVPDDAVLEDEAGDDPTEDEASDGPVEDESTGGDTGSRDSVDGAADEPGAVVEEESDAVETPVVDDVEEPAPGVAAPVGEPPAPAEPASANAEDAPPVDEQPAEVATASLSAVSAGEVIEKEPVLPAVASLMMSVVAAGREVTNETPDTVGDLVSASLAEAAADGYPIPTDVVVEEWTPPLEWLQRVPVLGPLVVTPLVSLAHAIPLIGDIIHPVIGFPIDHLAPEGAPKPRSFLVTSFDGTQIFVNFMPAEGLAAGESAPTVLNAPGIGLPGTTALELERDTLLPTDSIGIGALRDAGYNVVTWDPRGEWRSGGVMHLDSPDLEGRDVSHIISYIATLPEVALDADNDPKIGMTGASYGGGIQLAAAAIDHRIDAIVPGIAWNSLSDVLFPRGAVNSGWGTILTGVLALTLAREHPRIFPATIQGVLFGIVDEADVELLDSLGYQDQIGDITAPTLLLQGTVDTLFTLDQAHANALALIEAGTTTKVIWYCGGHGACLSDYNDGELIIDRTLSWLDRHVKGDESVDTGAQFEFVDQNGVWHSSEEYPVTQGSTVVAERTKRRTIPFLPLIGGSGPNPLIITRGLIATVVGLPSAAWALNAVDLHVPDATELTHIVGAPEVTLTYSGDGTAEHVYAQIIDDQTGLVLGNHATAIPIELDGDTHTVTFSLEQIAHTLKPGQSVTVQIVASTVKYFNFYSWGAITVEGLSVSLPTRAAAVVEPAA